MSKQIEQTKHSHIRPVLDRGRRNSLTLNGVGVAARARISVVESRAGNWVVRAACSSRQGSCA